MFWQGPCLSSQKDKTMANDKYTRKKNNEVSQDTLAKEMGAVPPQASDVEQAVLGAVMIEEQAAELVIGELPEEAFYHPRHRIIYGAMKDLHAENIAIDLLTVSERLKAHKHLDEIGGPAYLAELTQLVGAGTHLEYYINILKQKAIQRGLISASYGIMKMAYDDTVKVDDLMLKSQSSVFEVIEQNIRNRTTSVKDRLNSVLDEIQEAQTGIKQRGVTTGYNELERISMGWQKGNLIVIGARPGVGKTAIALNLAANAAIMGKTPVAFFSLEMTDVELIKRLIEAETGIPGDKVKGGSKLTNDDWSQLETHLTGLVNCDFYIDDTPALTTTEFKAKAKNLVTTKGVGIIFIDYLQLMKHPGAPNVREEVSEVSHTLKAVAKELKVPVIALAQLNRNVDNRVSSQGKPILSDIKESGAIEQDADIVMFIHRPDQMGLSEDPNMKQYAEIIVAKNRNGAVRTIPMIYKEDIVKFIEPDDPSYNLSNFNFNGFEQYNPFDR